MLTSKMETNGKNSDNGKIEWDGHPDEHLLTSSGNGTKNRNGTNSYSLTPPTNNGTSGGDNNNYKDDVVGICKNGMNTCLEEEGEIKCGIGSCSPRWLQIFASKQAFLVTFCLTWVLQGMFATYFVSVITTIEKLFQLQSKTTGMIMSAVEIGQISCTLLFTYYGGQGHRPRWIACGMVLFAICAFACSSPHFIFDQESTTIGGGGRSNDFFTSLNNNSNTNLAMNNDVCHNATITDNNNNSSSSCGEHILSEQQSKIKNVALIIFLISLLGVGMGQTPVYTLGISYIDDNVASRESPLYFAITIGVRILGPAFGFILGSFCTRLYYDLSVTPQFGPTDPRWIGAWWLGLVLDSVLLLFASLAMFSFPKKLKSSHSVVTPALLTRQENSRKHPAKLKDFPKTIKRLLKNNILMLRTASTVLHILPIAGLYTFLPKFLESQFRFPAYTANMAVGVGGILVMGVGIIISGVFILRVKPKARFVAGWIATAAFLYAFGMGILMFVGCPMDDFAGLQYQASGAKFYSNCSETCNCDDTKFSPVCGQDKFTYFSACYAGCRNVTNIDGNIEFTDCTCLRANNSGIMSFPSSLNAQIGYCDFDCNNFVWYILIFSVFVFIHSTSEVGSMLLTLRCVDPRDKAMALGVIQFAIGLFGNVPCSIIYGAVVDSACLVWDRICGKYGSCRLYDSAAFRTYFHGTTSAIMLCAFVVDLVVWYKADNINFATDDQLPTATQAEELTPITDKSDTSTIVLKLLAVKDKSSIYIPYIYTKALESIVNPIESVKIKI